MHLPKFEQFRPGTLEEVTQLLDDYGPRARLAAGGTDLFPRMKYGLARPEAIISLKGIAVREPELKDGHLHLDALTPLAAELARGNRNGITSTDLRKEAMDRGILTGRESHSRLSCIGHALRRAGLVNTGETRASDLEVTHGVQQTVWVEDLR